MTSVAAIVLGDNLQGQGHTPSRSLCLPLARPPTQNLWSPESPTQTVCSCCGSSSPVLLSADQANRHSSLRPKDREGITVWGCRKAGVSTGVCKALYRAEQSRWERIESGKVQGQLSSHFAMFWPRRPRVLCWKLVFWSIMKIFVSKIKCFSISCQFMSCVCWLLTPPIIGLRSDLGSLGVGSFWGWAEVYPEFP